MSPEINERTNILVPSAEEPVSDFEMVMAKIEHDGNRDYRGIENIALENENVKKRGNDEVQP